MRALFFLLLICNVLLFAWFMQLDQGAPPDQPSMPARGTLQLLEEPEYGNPGEPEYGNPSRCFQSAPFNREADAQVFASRINGSARVFEFEERQPIGYWVFLAARNSADEARRDVDRLRDAGFFDVGLVTESGMTNAISLGVYTSEERAQRRRLAIEEIGFEPQVEPRYQTRVRYRVVVHSDTAPEDSADLGWHVADCQHDGD